MKKLIIILGIVFIFSLPLFSYSGVAYADTSEEELIDQIEESVNGQLEDLDLSGLESILNNLNKELSNIK